jgi:hypothetical protein
MAEENAPTPQAAETVSEEAPRDTTSVVNVKMLPGPSISVEDPNSIDW